VNLWYQWRNSLPSFALGGMLLLFGGFDRHLSVSSRDWPVTSGTITQSYVRTKHDSLLGRSLEKGAMITYRYTVAGRTYNGGPASFGRMSGSNAEIVRRYPLGSVVEVHYDPEHPDLAVLEPGAGRGPNLLILLGIGLVGYGLWRGLR
jgi:hypothetical protein